MDGTIPRKRLGRSVLTAIAAMEQRYGLRCANVFHAGDGNLHPLILFDANDAGQLERAEASAAEILELCVENWAAPSPASTASASRSSTRCACSSRRPMSSSIPRGQARLRPDGLLNPGKAIPTWPAAPNTAMHVDSAASCAPICRASEGLMNGPRAPLPRALVASAFAARGRRKPLRLRGGGSKDFYGQAPPASCSIRAATRASSAYEPTELVVTARCGTPLAELEAAARRKASARLRAAAFRPGATVGGWSPPDLSGPRRRAGAVRDFRARREAASTGRASCLHFGGQVMKNVAGYDVSRLLAGSLGTLGLIVEVSLKVLPAAARRADAALRLARRARGAGNCSTPGAASRCRSPPAPGVDGNAACACRRLGGGCAAKRRARRSARRRGPDASAILAKPARADRRFFAVTPSGRRAVAAVACRRPRRRWRCPARRN
jgi:hypothetical protein